MRSYYIYELVSYGTMCFFIFVHLLQFWARAPWSSIHTLVVIGWNLATARFIFLVYLNFFEADSPYAAEVLWMFFWFFAGAFFLQEASVWLGVAERAAVALSGTKMTTSRLLELGGTKMIRNSHRFLQFWLIFITLPLLLVADWLRFEFPPDANGDSSTNFRNGTTLLRINVGVTGIVGCSAAATTVMWAGLSLFRDLSESFERIKDNVAPQQQAKQVHTMHVLFGITTVVGAAGHFVGVLFVIYSVWFHEVAKDVGPVVWSALLFGQMPPIMVFNHLLLEAPVHSSLVEPQEQSVRSLRSLKFRISAFLNLFPAPPRLSLLSTRLPTTGPTATNTGTGTRTGALSADVEAPTAGPANPEPITWQRPAPELQ
eukprot:TRINITY_DN3081_c0_g1_i1.p1 TRINITY_DN3081_c0_g1~~TRINITY_DN3081_c0_g1_i1.p1  ORF type:complete len:390 (-),score=74.90 TRINITY_DN3081_c0_g1_i1:60-1175(-)